MEVDPMAANEAISESYLDRYDAATATDQLQLLQKWFVTDSQGLFAELREHRPILVTPAFTLVTKFADVTEVLSREMVFNSRYDPALCTALGGRHILATDGDVINWRERSLLQVMLAPEDVPRLREVAGRYADEALDEAMPTGRIDAAGGLVRKVIIRICMEYLGFRGADPNDLSHWVRPILIDMVTNFANDPEMRKETEHAGGEMMGCMRDLVAQRRAGITVPHRDLLTRLLNSNIGAGLDMDDERISINLAGILLGYVENGMGSATHLVEELLRHPELPLRDLAEDADRFDPYVWEALRLNPFFKMLSRKCVSDYVLAGGTPRETLIPAGALVLTSIESAMSDEDQVSEPAAFRLDRPAHILQMHFGFGHHNCVGWRLGQATVAESVRRLFLRDPWPLPAPEGEIRRGPEGFPRHLVVGLGRRP
ncbi:cytochrome P450 [Nocardia sp. NPDC088792]|uniref:cytochrome P450 n=1 Tax=Nocardia sp. NPDC088792 TaxID=3364332 RepID=UPI00382DD410